MAAEKQTEEESTLTFEARSCPVEKVTIYPDRAEVSRRIATVLSSGRNTITIEKLPDMVDPASLRVEGQGEATVVEVVFRSEAVPKTERDWLVKGEEYLNRREKELHSELTVLKKQQELLDGFATAILKGDLNQQGKSLGGDLFRGTPNFLSQYSYESRTLERRRLDTEHMLFQVEMERRTRLPDQQNDAVEAKKCVIVVQCGQSCKVVLLVSYVTTCASWKPTYDIRMYSQEETLKVIYYGRIQQSTGEDWRDAKLYLSTALPSTGGDVPELPTAELRLRSAVKKEPELKECNLLPSDDVEESFAFHQTSSVGQGVASTLYEIADCSTIPTDNAEHKVTIGLVDLKPQISYVSVPKRIPHAYMLAKVTNTSSFTFLAGEASIFLDNTFVRKASLKDVYSMEEFDCSLGVDPAIKVIYKPHKKFCRESRLGSKSVSFLHEQVIEVENRHEYGISLKVTDQLPQSCDSNLKIHLLEPQINTWHSEKSEEKNVTLNKQNNLEWTVDLQPQETKKITLKYTVDHLAKFTAYTVEHEVN